MALGVGPRPQPWQAPEQSFISHRLEFEGLPRILCCPSEACLASRARSVPSQLRSSGRWGRFNQQISENRAEAVSESANAGCCPDGEREAALLKRASEKQIPSALRAWEGLPPSGQLRMTGPPKVLRPAPSQTNAFCPLAGKESQVQDRVLATAYVSMFPSLCEDRFYLSPLR